MFFTCYCTLYNLCVWDLLGKAELCVLVTLTVKNKREVM